MLGEHKLIEVLTIETKSLGDRSYLAHDGEVAVVVDPQRDFTRFLEAAEEAGVRITHVFETHMHNDYVSGGLALAEATGAVYVVPGADNPAFAHEPAADGSRFVTGEMVVTAIATPGHTPHHLAYSLTPQGGESIGVFTGGSMLFGAVGRTDLIAEEMTEELTRAQYRSVRRLSSELPSAAAVLPTHGFGSFCSASPTSGNESTVGQQREVNVALTSSDEDVFVKDLIASLGQYPRYYAHMGPANLKGALAPRYDPPRRLDAAQLRSAIDAGGWVVDLRNRKAFAKRHIKGTISVELGDSFVTFLGWAIPWGTELTLVGETPEDILEAQIQLSRIGIDEISGMAVGGTDSLAQGRVSSYRSASFGEVGPILEDDGTVILDVRRHDEVDQGRLHQALHIPFFDLEERMDEVPPGQVWVHCAGGFRAALAASLLDRAGRDVVLIDDDWSKVAKLGYRVTD